MLRQILLNPLLVQQLGTEFEGQRQFVFEGLTVGLNLDCMAVLKLAKGLTVFLLSLKQVLIPLLVELLILLDVCLFALFSLLSLIEDEFLHPTVVILLLQLSDTILCHFGLNVFALLFASQSVVLKDFTVN